MAIYNSLPRRDFLKHAAAGAAAALAGPLHAEPSNSGARKPNVVIILADDLGYGDLGCYGSKDIATPNIDALAKHGLRFTDFHSNGPICSPTRAALLTGRYQQRCGIEEVFRPQNRTEPGLPLSEITFAQLLKNSGYATAVFGKWHLGYPTEYNPVRRGFNTFRGFLSGNVDYHSHIDGSGEPDWWNGTKRAPEDGYLTDLITAHGVDYIKRNKAKPFCLYLAHGSPHFPYQGRKDAAVRVNGVAGQDGKNSNDRQKTYREMVEALDEGVGRIVEAIKQESLQRDTLVFFCSDNGATGPGSNGDLNGHKGQLLEGGHRVPAIASWPGHIEAGETSETVLTMDLFPTLAAIAEAPLPDGVKFDGVNLLPLLTKRKPLPDRTVFWRTGAGDREKVARKGQWKLRQTGDGPELYNLTNDPAEKTNRAAADPEHVADLQKSLAAWEADVDRAP